MAYNHGREDRKWRIWKEAEEKISRKCGVDEAIIEKIRIDDRADFNSNRRFYRWASDFGEYLEGIADREKQTEVRSVSDLLDEIESENLYLALITVDRRTLPRFFTRPSFMELMEFAEAGKNEAEPAHWLIDEEAAEVVRKIFRLCVEGYGPTQIANILFSEDIKTPTEHWQAQGRKRRTTERNCQEAA